VVEKVYGQFEMDHSAEGRRHVREVAVVGRTNCVNVRIVLARIRILEYVRRGRPTLQIKWCAIQIHERNHPTEVDVSTFLPDPIQTQYSDRHYP